MKTYARIKSVEEIRKQCEELGVNIDTEGYMRGLDHIVLSSPGVQVFYNSFNGHFFGSVSSTTRVVLLTTHFTHESELDGTSWFDALLNFFYSET